MTAKERKRTLSGILHGDYMLAQPLAFQNGGRTITNNHAYLEGILSGKSP